MEGERKERTDSSLQGLGGLCTARARDEAEAGVDEQHDGDEDVADEVERAPGGEGALDGHGAEREDDVVEQQLRDGAEEALEGPVHARRPRDAVLVENKAHKKLLFQRRHRKTEHGRVQEEQVIPRIHALHVLFLLFPNNRSEKVTA